MQQTKTSIVYCRFPVYWVQQRYWALKVLPLCLYLGTLFIPCWKILVAPFIVREWVSPPPCGNTPYCLKTTLTSFVTGIYKIDGIWCLLMYLEAIRLYCCVQCFTVITCSHKYKLRMENENVISTLNYALFPRRAR